VSGRIRGRRVGLIRDGRKISRWTTAAGERHTQEPILDLYCIYVHVPDAGLCAVASMALKYFQIAILMEHVPVSGGR
jgi:hypothetical protein